MAGWAAVGVGLALAASSARAADMPAQTGMDEMDMGAMSMNGALGPYSMNREASGTAWQPDASPSMGSMTMTGSWMFMRHLVLNGVYDRQSGPRGGEKSFVSGMAMGMATHYAPSGDTLQFKAMLSPDPLMGKSGYPLLLQAGETANGTTPLVDRQHPHDLFMELSASYSHALNDRSSVFVYAGLPGEPAFGPPAFMHRLSAMDSPEAPITHHWLDSSHVTFGVVTAGYVRGPLKIDVSRFNGREPDEHRYDIETGALDSTSARLTLNPTANLSLQASWADVKSPEELDPTEDQTRYSASAVYTANLGPGGWWSATAAWGRRSSGHHDLDAFALEAAAHPNDQWTLFGRTERIDTNELVPGPGGGHGPTYTVGKASAGLVRDFAVTDSVKLGLGGLYSRNFVPSALKPLYGDRDGGMVFLRLKIS